MNAGLFRAQPRMSQWGSALTILLSVILLTITLAGTALGQTMAGATPGPVKCPPDTIPKFRQMQSKPFRSAQVQTPSMTSLTGGGTNGPLGAIALPRVLVFVNDTLYPRIQTQVNTYVADIQHEGYEVEVYRIAGGTAENLKSIILSRYENGRLKGCTLIGQLPYALYERPNEIKEGDYVAFPCDMFLCDLDAQWLDTNPFPGCQTGLYDGYVNGENPGPEIFVGRIDGSNLDPIGFENEVQRTIAYMDKTHAWHSGMMPRRLRALSYPGSWNALRDAYPDGDFLPYDQVTTLDYRERLTRDAATNPSAYEYVEVEGHSWPESACLRQGQWYDCNSVLLWPARPQFYTLIHCQISLYTWDNPNYVSHGCVGNYYIFNNSQSSLVTIGSTKVTGGQAFSDTFYLRLAEHNSIGEAYRKSVCDMAPFDEWEIHSGFGHVILGDPLCMPFPPPMHVRPDGDDSQTGFTWETAKRTISGAISALPANMPYAEIWVAQGTYNERVTFNKSIRLYGGFASTEEKLEDRNWQLNPTVIDGLGGDVITINNRQYTMNIVDGFTIRNSTGSGHGIAVTSSPLTLEHDTITGNTGASGGGINAQSAQLTIRNCTLSGNSNTANGAGICAQSSQLDVKDCSFSTNSAGTYGGGIYASLCTGAVSNCTFSQDTAATRGGGVYLSSSGLSIADCSFAGNSASIGGGLACLGQPAPTLSRCTFSSNTGTSYGGALSCDQSDAAAAECTFTGNTAQTMGGAILIQTCSPSIFTSIISGNHATDYGGGIHLMSSAATITNNLIKLNTANYGCGIFNCNSSSSTIVNNTFSDNTSGSSWGGAIYTLNSTPTIKNNVIAFNSQGITTCGGTPILSHNLTYYNWNGEYWGVDPDTGSIYADPLFANRPCGDFRLLTGSPAIDAGIATGAPTVDLDGNPRPFGTAPDIGAYELRRIYVKADSPGPTFDGHTWRTAYHTIGQAITAASAYDEIWVAAGTYNEAVNIKDGVRLLGGFSGAESVKVARDPAKYVSFITGAGAERAVTFNLVTDPDTRIDGFKISSSRTDGVGVHCYGSGGVIEGNTIAGNGGGGIRIYEVDNCALLTVARNTVSGNHAVEYGGGIYLDTLDCSDTYSNAAITNNIIRGNSAAYGGGICDREANGGVSISSNTIVDNTATNSGGGIYLIDASPTIENNIISNNSVYGISSSGFGCNPMTAPLRNNDLFGNSPANYYQVDPGPTDISMDPLFLDRANGDLHLSSGSPCINAGCNDTRGQLAVDIDGQARISGVVDIGADEYAIQHVSTSGNDANDGLSWAQAKRTVQAAVNAAPSRGEVWVKAGTYNEHIAMGAVQLYGGFAGTEAKREQRNWTANLTTLDCGDGGNTISIGTVSDPFTAVDGFTITSNPAMTGKGIYCNAASGTIAHNQITGNKGTGVYGENYCALNITGNTFTGNNGAWGGGIYLNKSSASITGNTMTGNHASDYNGGGAIGSYWSSLLVSGNTLSGNTADWYGGALSCYDGLLTITDNIVTNNTATNAGGLFVVSAFGAEVSRNTVTDNNASMGGGIYYSNIWDSTIANNLVVRNGGGGIYGEDQGEPTIINNTVSDNTGSYGGIYLAASGSPTLKNNIISYNSGYGIYADLGWGATPVLSNNDVCSNTSGNYMNTSPGTGDISLNPFFMSRTGSNYRLKGKSPCIDAGTNTGAPTVDKDGRIRPIDGDANGTATTDIGAYERPMCLTAALKDIPNGTHISLEAVSVVAFFAGADPSGQNWVYVENIDRTGGIRVKTDKTFTVNQSVSVSGTIQTDTVNGERYIEADSTSPVADGTFTIAPIGMRNQWIGGKASGFEPVIRNGFGFYNVGMLIASWGRVTYVDTTGHYFYMDDGLHLFDCSGYFGVKVLVPSGVSLPAGGSYVKVKGISSASSVFGGYARTVRVRSASDITTVTSWISTPISLATNTWNVLSIPGIPANGDRDSVFVGTGGSWIILEGNLKYYDPIYQQWIVDGGPCGTQYAALIGDGYMLNIPSGGATAYAYQRTPVEGDQMLSLPSGSTTPQKFSLVGNPFDAPIPWANCIVTDGIWSGTLTEAIEAGLIHKVCSWNGTDWVQVTDLSTGNMAARTCYEVYPVYNDIAMFIPAP